MIHPSSSLTKLYLEGNLNHKETHLLELQGSSNRKGQYWVSNVSNIQPEACFMKNNNNSIDKEGGSLGSNINLNGVIIIDKKDSCKQVETENNSL